VLAVNGKDFVDLHGSYQNKIHGSLISLLLLNTGWLHKLASSAKLLLLQPQIAMHGGARFLQYKDQP
jgi:hypothetical protein